MNTSGLPKMGDDQGHVFTVDKGDGLKPLKFCTVCLFAIKTVFFCSFELVELASAESKLDVSFLLFPGCTYLPALNAQLEMAGNS